MIAKNEEKNIEKCLEAAKKLTAHFEGAEIVVVDTGSEDQTPELAKKHGAKTYEYTWNGDFSAARNYAAQMAKNDLILVVDCDEFLMDLSEETVKQFKDAVSANAGLLGMTNIVSKYEQGGEWLDSSSRIGRFYDRRLYRFYGEVHENIRLISDADSVGGYFDLPLSFRHVGYDTPETRAKKASRNKELLLKELEKNPSDPYILFQIGKCYAALQDKDNAIRYYEQALELPLDLQYSYVQDMLVSYGYCLLDQKRIRDALGLESVLEELKNNADFMFLMGLIHMKNAMFDQAIEDFTDATKAGVCSVAGVNSYKAFYNIGVIYEVTGDLKNAVSYYNKCPDYRPARNRLAEISKTI